MKQALTTLFITFFTFSLNAQIQKGTILVGGNANFNRQKSADEFSVNNGYLVDESTRDLLAVQPQIGFFATESLILGIGLSYEYYSFQQRSSLDGSPYTPYFEKRNVIFINPYLTNLTRLTDKFYFTTSINLFAGVGKGKFGENDEIETNIFELRIHAIPGLLYFISNKWALRGTIGQLFYNRRQEKLITDIGLSEDPKNVDSGYGLNASFNTFTIGFQYYLNNKAD